jgi:hypothetical protein
MTERSQQVQFMNRIYKNASHVLVWLGPDDEAMAEPAFKLVRQLNEIFEDKEKREKFHIEHTDQLEERPKDPWIPLTHLTRLPWVSQVAAIPSPRNTKPMPLLTSMSLTPVHSCVDSTGDWDQGARNALLGRRGD